MAALVVLVVLIGVSRLRDHRTPAARPPQPGLDTPTTAYVPAVVRGDPIPVVDAPAGVTVARGGSTLHGFALTAPGAKPSDIMAVLIFAPAAHMTLERMDGIKLYEPHAPTWLNLAGTLESMNAALASLRYVPSGGTAQQLYLQVNNKTLGTNPRRIVVPIQVT